jgi:hypothetical protein
MSQEINNLLSHTIFIHILEELGKKLIGSILNSIYELIRYSENKMLLPFGHNQAHTTVDTRAPLTPFARSNRVYVSTAPYVLLAQSVIKHRTTIPSTARMVQSVYPRNWATSWMTGESVLDSWRRQRFYSPLPYPYRLWEWVPEIFPRG